MNDSLNPVNDTQKQRIEQLKRWLIDVHGEGSSLEPASADASFRHYYRAQQGDASYIVMDAPPANNKNNEFVTLANNLKNADVNSPAVLAYEEHHGFILLEDFGDTQYLDSLNDESADDLYSDAIKTLGKMQTTLDFKPLPAYDRDFLLLEMRLFPEWYFTKHRKITLSDTQQSILETVFSLCAESALEQPTCFVHRDYHSRNLMVTDSNSPGVLDFQDAVSGPLSYDIASLLRDCYISWPDEFVYPKLEQYRQQCVTLGLTEVGEAQFRRWFDLMALQRHIKVMGIFCRLNLRDGKPHYMDDLPIVFRYIYKTCQKYPELNDFLQLLDDTGTSQEFL